MSNHSDRPTGSVEPRPLTLFCGGGALSREEVVEALMCAVPWAELGAAISPDQPVPVPVMLWPDRRFIEDARRLLFNPDRVREMLEEMGLLGLHMVMLCSPEEERVIEMLESVAGAFREIELNIEPIEVEVETADIAMMELLERGQAVLWLKWPLVQIQPVHEVSFQMPSPGFYVGSYHKIPVIINQSAGFGIDDLQFVIPSGSAGGQISLSRDERFDPAHPDIMFLAGHKPGSYKLQALRKSSGQLLAEAEFDILDHWPHEMEGPSLWTSGDYILPGVPGGWGGGSATDPENWNVNPAKGTRQVAILLVDTKSQRFKQSDLPAIRKKWENLAFKGFTHNGQTHSTAHYFKEASYGNFTIDGKVYGPVSLPKEWSSYLQDNGNYKSNIWQDCATAGDSLIDYSKYESLVLVIQSVDATTTTKKLRVWAHADSMVAKSDDGDCALGTVDMPADGNDFDLCAVLAHELGHNLALGDIYEWNGHPPQIQARELGKWALMAKGKLSHPVLVHRMKLGWVPKTALKLYNFQALGGGPVNEKVRLHPVELKNPPSGSYSGVEVRIAQDWNYYFEYRVAQSSQIGDQDLPTNDRVLGTDARFDDALEVAQRRKPVMLLPKDSDGDGPVLGLNQDFRQKDVTDEYNPVPFTATVTKIDGAKAELHIQYGIYGQPDPSIRKWKPPVYKSPDIEVRNDRSKADSKWLNVPWENHHNTVVAKVTNKGKINAPKVGVDFYVKDMTTNEDDQDPTRIWFDEDVKDVPAGQTVPFEGTWMPAKKGHYCIEAWIRLYQTPPPDSKIEVTEFNNRAQSNYDRFISKTASAASREVTVVNVRNPYSKPARVHIRCAKSGSPLYRTYLEHTWLWLNGGETRPIQVMFEYAADEDTVWTPELEQYIGVPNDVSICAMIDQPDSALEQAPLMLGGLTAQVVTGRATFIDPLNFDPPDDVQGWVRTVDNGSPVPGGQVLLIVRRGDEIENRLTSVNANGEFLADGSGQWDTIQAYYVPMDGYGDCYSRVIRYP